MSNTNNLSMLFRLCFFLSIVATQPVAALPGEIIFVHPMKHGEIWIANTDGTNAHQLFKHTFGYIRTLSVQQSGRYVLVTTKTSRWNPGIDMFLLDRERPQANGKNVTPDTLDWISDADISSSGNIALISGRRLYLIRHHELGKQNLEPEKLLDQETTSVEWAPNGTQLVFRHSHNLSLLDLVTREVHHISHNASHPAFSPNGWDLAFSLFIGENKGATIGIVKLSMVNGTKKLLGVRLNYKYTNPTWAPNGRYIAYVSRTIQPLKNIEEFQAIGNFAIPEEGGDPEPILLAIKGTIHLFEWTDKPAYSVEPAKSLVTTWGRMKVPK